MLLILYLIFAVICSVLSYGLMFGYIQRCFKSMAQQDYYYDMLLSIFAGCLTLLFPLSFIIIFILTEHNKYGLKFK